MVCWSYQWRAELPRGQINQAVSQELDPPWSKLTPLRSSHFRAEVHTAGREMMKKILLGLLVIFVSIQFYRPAKNLSAAPGPNDLLVLHPAPPAVSRILTTACYDCHSNNTRYPWYAEVEPVGWWLTSHIHDGQRHLNFSEFGAYTRKQAAHKLDQISDQVGDHTMPLKSYTWIHRDARLSEAQIRQVTDWADALGAQFDDSQ